MDCGLPLKKYDFTECRACDPALIRIDPVVRELCKQNACGHYGKNHMCPPAVKDLEAWEKDIARYEKAVILTKCYPVRSSYDMKGMLEGMAHFQRTLVSLKGDLEIQFPGSPFLLFGAGACSICETCALMENEPCRYPEKAFPSLEACGIDVMSLSKSAGVKYHHGKNTVTYLGMVLFRTMKREPSRRNDQGNR